ncbi:response regulator [Afipia broomeae]|uniref:Response regulatory domain-containing protein n=1 Tax=Afipia broomeae ATCC 49717 TaxID=883078 RepID=K8PFS2_9BRAD|nr:response regulator [Afipia broomeae]EKS41487.1 hypothetical protein HMPREF9695_00579 [Afipia broomeae ATCC 49717]
MTGEIFILVVEDEMLLQALLEEALKDGGYDGKVVSTGEEAIKLFDADEPKYRALITDVNLGRKVDGWDVARRAREINADIPVVYITGHGGADWASRGVPNSIVLTKPFATAQLITAVSQLINTGQTPAP